MSQDWFFFNELVEFSRELIGISGELVGISGELVDISGELIEVRISRKLVGIREESGPGASV